MVHKKGVSLIELLAVVVLIGIIATIATITIGNTISNTKMKADIESANGLNQATYYYFLTEDKDLFLDLEADEEKIQFLVDQGYLDKFASPLVNGSTFSWDNDTQFWVYSLFDQVINQIDELDLNNFDENDYEHSGDWESSEGVLISDFGMLFIDNPNTEYTITVSAKIEEGSSGGFGILFDTSVIDGEDSGYILQFDRGYGRGSVLIRPRNNGSEGNVIQAFRFDHSNSFIPDKNTVDGALWWNSEHEVKLTVVVTEGVTYTKILSVTIDDQLLFDDFLYETNVGASINFTGLRTWASVEVEFYLLTI